MIDGTRAWIEVTTAAFHGMGPALALTRPAGHHATRSVAMGFGLVNFAAASVAAHLASTPSSRVAILDWDVHYGNGVAEIFRDDARVRYCSIHEAGSFPGTGMDEKDVGPLGNLLRLPLHKGSGSNEFFSALRQKALPFLLCGGSALSGEALRTGGVPPDLLVICAGYDALDADPLASMSLLPSDFGAAAAMIVGEFGFPRERIALGLEGGYDLSMDVGMPAALVQTGAALVLQ